jgi:ABC-2 type transport system permease protein
MMKPVFVIAGKQMREAFRNKMFVIIGLLFLGLSILSVYIGSATKRAEIRLYHEIVARLTAQGTTALPQAPEIHTLTILANLIQYVAIVGAILAVVLGYNALTEEKETGGLKLILSRPVYRDTLLTGKLMGNGGIIAALLIVVFVINLSLVAVVGGVLPTIGEVVRLATFVLLALVYMLFFLTLSTLLSVHMKSGAGVFLVSLVIWMTVTFVIPQLAETQMANSTVVNSVTGTTNQIPQDTLVSTAIDFLSPTWHLQTIGNELLEVSSGSVSLGWRVLVTDLGRTLLILLAPLVAAVAVAYVTFVRSEALDLE